MTRREVAANADRICLHNEDPAASVALWQRTLARAGADQTRADIAAACLVNAVAAYAMAAALDHAFSEYGWGTDNEGIWHNEAYPTEDDGHGQ